MVISLHILMNVIQRAKHMYIVYIYAFINLSGRYQFLVPSSWLVSDWGQSGAGIRPGHTMWTVCQVRNKSEKYVISERML